MDLSNIVFWWAVLATFIAACTIIDTVRRERKRADHDDQVRARYERDQAKIRELEAALNDAGRSHTA